MSALPTTSRRAGAHPAPEVRSDAHAPGRRLAPPRVGRRLATTGLLIALGVALLAAVPALHRVLQEIGHIGAGWIAVAVALELASAISFVVVFRLFFDRLDPGDARALAWTAQGSGALLPGGGAGGLAIGGWLIHLTGTPLRWVARRSGGLFFLSAGVSGIGLIAAGVALIAGAPGPHDLSTVVLPTVLAAAATIVIAVLPTILRARTHAPRWLAAIATGVSEAEQTTFSRRSSWRLLGALGYLVFDVAVLWVILRAFGHSPSIAAVALAYSIGYAACRSPAGSGCSTPGSPARWCSMESRPRTPRQP